MMSFRLIGDIGYRFAAAASVSGPLFGLANTWEIVRPIPILQMHGTSDILVAYEGNGDYWPITKTIEYWAEKNNCNPFYSTISLPDIVQGDNCTIQKISYDSYSGESTLIHYKGIGMGHSWPGSATTFPSEGNKNMDINANVEILNFFKNYSLSPDSVDNGIVNGSFIFEELDRAYIVYIPQNYQQNMPAVVMLHGSYPDDAEWMMNYTQMNEIADTASFIVVYPFSIEPRWNANSGIPSIQESNANDIGFIGALIDTIKSQYNIDLNRVYCCGLNYGGWMASELFCQIGNRFAAGARVNTSLGYNQAARSILSESFPVILFNGTSDTYLPWPDGKEGVMGGEEAVNWWVENNGCSPFYNTVSLPDIDPNDGCSVEKISYKNSSDETLVVFYKVINGGLSWPSAVGNEPWDKPRNMDVNAGVEIWNFFKNIPKNVSILGNSKHLPDKHSLSQNFPNPFNPSTKINYSIKNKSFVTLKIFDVLGRAVQTLINKEQSQGNYEVEFDGSNLTSGIYFYRIQAGDFIETKKMLLMK